MNLPPEKVHVVYGGVDLEGYEQSDLPMEPPAIGFLCRMNEYFGLGVIVDAFIKLKQNTEFKDVKLYLTGGYTGDDKKFVDKMMKKIAQAGFKKDVQILEEFDKANRIKFLKKLTLLSVPVLEGVGPDRTIQSKSSLSCSHFFGRVVLSVSSVSKFWKYGHLTIYSGVILKFSSLSSLSSVLSTEVILTL